jgi:lysozyme family protein
MSIATVVSLGFASDDGPADALRLRGAFSPRSRGGRSKHVMERYAWSYRALPALVRRGLMAPLAINDWRERYVR